LSSDQVARGGGGAVEWARLDDLPPVDRLRPRGRIRDGPGADGAAAADRAGHRERHGAAPAGVAPGGGRGLRARPRPTGRGRPGLRRRRPRGLHAQRGPRPDRRGAEAAGADGARAARPRAPPYGRAPVGAVLPGDDGPASDARGRQRLRPKALPPRLRPRARIVPDGPRADAARVTRPFGTSLRRDPGDPRGLRARIEAVLLERLEEAVDAACLEVLVEVRRVRNLPPPVADDAEDRAEFDRLVRAFLGRLEASMTVGLAAGERGRLASAAPATGAGTARLLADQASLATR